MISFSTAFPAHCYRPDVSPHIEEAKAPEVQVLALNRCGKSTTKEHVIGYRNLNTLGFAGWRTPDG